MVRFLIPDQELGTIMEKSANMMEEDETVDENDTNSRGNLSRQESKRKKREKRCQRIQGYQRADSIRKKEVSGKNYTFMKGFL